MILPNELYELVAAQPQEVRCWIVERLLTDGKVSYDDISRGYIAYIQKLRQDQTNDYWELQKRIVHVFSDLKKNREQNINECMKYLDSKGRVNLSGRWRKKVYREE